MNEFTNTDLTEIHRCLKYMVNGSTTPYSCHTVALLKKVRGMIANSYCEHRKYIENLVTGFSCEKCGEPADE